MITQERWMPKRHTIQVPVDDDLLERIARCSKEAEVSHAETMRRAFRDYYERLVQTELDRRYLEGYRKKPADASFAKAQLAAAGEIFEGDDW
jgi:hypothetical protein